MWDVHGLGLALHVHLQPKLGQRTEGKLCPLREVAAVGKKQSGEKENAQVAEPENL